MDELLLLFRSNSRAHLSAIERVKTLFPFGNSCELHTLIHGALGEKAAWKAWRKDAAFPIRLYHQDQIPDEVRSFLLSYDPELPVVLGRFGKDLRILLSAEEIRALKGSEQAFMARLHSL